MVITVRLFASLRSHLPAGSDGKQTRVELTTGATVRSVCESLGIPVAAVAIVMVAGKSGSLDSALAGDCELSLFPAVAGG